MIDSLTKAPADVSQIPLFTSAWMAGKVIERRSGGADWTDLPPYSENNLTLPVDDGLSQYEYRVLEPINEVVIIYQTEGGTVASDSFTSFEAAQEYLLKSNSPLKAIGYLVMTHLGNTSTMELRKT
jgi:hypothetical protein